MKLHSFFELCNFARPLMTWTRIENLCREMRLVLVLTVFLLA